MAKDIKRIVNESFPKATRVYRYFFSHKVWKYKLSHKRLLKEIRNKKEVRVIFFASSLGMWRYQGVYDILSKDDRFHCNIIVMPMKTYKNEEKENCTAVILNYFNKLGIPFINGYKDTDNTIKWLRELNPEILFYPQPYGGIFGNGMDEVFFRNRLLCYCPYGVSTIASAPLYNSSLQNVAWKLFYPTNYNLEDARILADNHGENVVVTGDPNIDKIGQNPAYNPWKHQNKIKKRIIWAPHFTVKPSFCLNRASFVWLNEIMLELAKVYKDEIQIAFKPHPRLRTELYDLEGWGKERTDIYYNTWASGYNTQLEEGEYMDLFTTSDAMIHDCGSFSVEYLYTRKPVMFTSTNPDEDISGLSNLGQACLKQHYIGVDKSDIVSFIDHLLKAEDPMKSEREQFYEKTLKSPKGESVAEYIYYILKQEFKFS